VSALLALSPDDVWSLLEGVGESLLQTYVVPVDPTSVDFADPVTASILIDGSEPVLVSFSCEPATAAHITRVMFDLDPTSGEPAAEDLVDALGEVVNVLGGNVKALIEGAHQLGLPRVHAGPAPAEQALVHLALGWDGHLAAVTITAPSTDHEESR
jgi:chemotaxis protein CheX